MSVNIITIFFLKFNYYMIVFMGINQYQDSIYSLEQITSGAITAGSDEFTAHAQVIA